MERKKILLVGGSKGLGETLAQHLRASDHQVACTAREGLDLTWGEGRIRLGVKNHLSHLCGDLDVLIVTAGMGAYHRPTVSDRDVQHLFQVNALGPMAVFRACQRPLLRSRGKAVFITSTAARRPGSGGLSYYAAAKGAIHSWVISEGRRQIKHGVGLCAVAPGFFDSPMTAEMNPALKAATVKAIPAGRYGKDWEIAQAITDMVWWSNWVIAGQIYEASGGA